MDRNGKDWQLDASRQSQVANVLYLLKAKPNPTKWKDHIDKRQH